MVKAAVFASGSGTNFEALAEKEKSGELKADLDCLICDHSDAYALKRAEKLGIESFVFELKDFESKKAYEEAILKKLRERGIELVILSGYMKIITPVLLEAYPEKIINLHPAWLPEFKGAHAIQDAYEAGVDKTGVTVHYIDEGVDTGPVILQERVEIDPSWSLDQLETAVHQKEYDLFWRGINKAIEEDL